MSIKQAIRNPIIENKYSYSVDNLLSLSILFQDTDNNSINLLKSFMNQQEKKKKCQLLFRYFKQKMFNIILKCAKKICQMEKKEIAQAKSIDFDNINNLNDLCNLFFFLLGLYQNDNIHQIYHLLFEKKKSIYYISEKCGLDERTIYRYKQKISEFIRKIKINHQIIIKIIKNLDLI